MSHDLLERVLHVGELLLQGRYLLGLDFQHRAGIVVFQNPNRRLATAALNELELVARVRGLLENKTEARTLTLSAL